MAIMRMNFSMAIAMILVCGIAVDVRAQLRATLHASGFQAPVGFVQDPTHRAVQFVVEQRGVIRTVVNGAVQATPFLDIQSVVYPSGGEKGLLSLAFAPDYMTSGRFFVYFNNVAGDTVIARFRRSADPLVADVSSRFDLRWGGPAGPTVIHQTSGVHNGGNLMFGPDGFLYICLGDGGVGNQAQDPQLFLGKALRIDVNVLDADTSGYQVPPDNPFLSGGPANTRPEIWDFGLRNPWRYSFDDPARGGTGALVIADVGQSSWEEIDYEPANHGGHNYGWPLREGAHDFIPSTPPALLPLVDPIHEYDHSDGSNIAGGFVYRGHLLGNQYKGRYFFADSGFSRVWSIGLTIDPMTGEAHKSNLLEHTSKLGTLGYISSIGIDVNGELHVVSYSQGKIWKLMGPAQSGDLDGDALADITVYRPGTGWLTAHSRTGFMTNDMYALGTVGDVLVPGDYDGDGTIDPAVFRPSTGIWSALQSSTNFMTSAMYAWGLSTDVPVPGDYDGDGKTDPAVYRPSTGSWYILQSSTGYATSVGVSWGLSTDLPMQGDYDGDGKTDPAVFRQSTGLWAILKSSTNYTTSMVVSWGLSTDVAVPGDYDGDGKIDPAVYRPSTGAWYSLRSSVNYSSYLAVSWGLSTDTPVPADYDGDGKTDPAVFRSSTGNWYVLQSSTGYSTSFGMPWGMSGDVPILKRP